MKTTSEDIDNRLKIVAIQATLQGQETLVTPNRKLVREFSVQEVLRGGKKASERKLVLLTDMVVVVKVKRSGYGQGTLFPLNRISVAAVSDSSAVLKHNIEITLSVGPKKEKRRFAMITAADRDACVNAITAQANVSASQPSPAMPHLTRESSMLANSSEAKKGIFQKLRATRTMSVDEGNAPAHLSEPATTLSGSGGNGSLSQASGAVAAAALRESQSAGASTTTALPRPSMTRQSSATVNAPAKSPRDKIGMARESSPRTVDDRKSPRPWASASSSSISAVGTAEDGSESRTSTASPSSASSETTTTLARG